MKKWLVLLVVLVSLTACLPKAEIPPAPVSTTPLVEYSIDGGETWHVLTEGEVKNLSASIVQIRKTDQGVEHELTVMGDISVPWFSGSVKRDEGTITAEGRGALMIKIGTTDYAKIVME